MKLVSIVPVAAAALLAGCATAPTGNTVDDITRFRAVNVAPIQFAAEALGPLPSHEHIALESELFTALKSGIAPSLLTEEPSANVVRIELTVTELNASSPAVNVLTTALLFVPFDAGGVAFEARFYDGESRAPFARTAYRHTSTPLELKGSFRRYGHATKALHDWAEEITSGLAATGSRNIGAPEYSAARYLSTSTEGR
jgi:hypothetical protein